MANLLTIIKEPNDYFTFVLNGDVTNSIKNTRNDLLTIGNLAHFKTSQGANLIKEQDILFSNVTIVDGVTSLSPISVDDLFTKLISVGYFDWIIGTSGTGGVNRFDELLDTFSYFGKDGQGVRVNESELRLEPYVLPNTEYLNYFPSPLVPDKILKVNAAGTGFELVNAFNVITQEIRENYTDTTPSEDAIFKALQAIQTNIPISVPKITFIADGVQDTFNIGVLAIIKAVFWNGALLNDNDWTQSGTNFTLTFIPSLGELIKPI